MSIPNQALVFVADGRKMLFLRNHGGAAQLDLRTDRMTSARTPRTAK